MNRDGIVNQRVLHIQTVGKMLFPLPSSYITKQKKTPTKNKTKKKTAT
jgi:hypothetical protein